jgi:hypothetical protein
MMIAEVRGLAERPGSGLEDVITAKEISAINAEDPCKARKVS